MNYEDIEIGMQVYSVENKAVKYFTVLAKFSYTPRGVQLKVNEVKSNYVERGNNVVGKIITVYDLNPLREYLIRGKKVEKNLEMKVIMNVDLDAIIRGLNEPQRRELTLRLGLADNLSQNLLNIGMSKEEFKKEFKCDNDFIIGAKNYRIIDIAKMEAFFREKQERKFVSIKMKDKTI